MKYTVLKLKKTLSRRDKKTGYEGFRYDFTIPAEIVRELGWDKYPGKEFLCKIQGNKLVIEKE